VYLKASKGVSLSCGLFLWTATAFAQTTAPAPATGLPLGISNFSSWRFEQVGDHLHLIGQAAIQGAQIQFFADDVDLYVDTNRIVASGNVVFSNADGQFLRSVSVQHRNWHRHLLRRSGHHVARRQGRRRNRRRVEPRCLRGQDPDV
jgi:hypothetical protein